MYKDITVKDVKLVTLPTGKNNHIFRHWYIKLSDLIITKAQWL